MAPHTQTFLLLGKDTMLFGNLDKAVYQEFKEKLIEISQIDLFYFLDTYN